MPAGRLNAELDGPHAKFTMEYPDRPDDLHPDADWYDHFAVERFHGMKLDEDEKSPTYGQTIEDWQHIHTGSHKFVKGPSDHHARWPEPVPEDHPDFGKETPPPGPHRYRALVYRIYERPASGVRMLQTDGHHSNTVVI